MDKRELMDDDGENLAVRCFLGMYQCGGNPSVKSMKIHLEHSGFNGCWPDWVNDPKNAGHLTKGGAQSWLRHLFGLERSAQDADAARLDRLQEELVDTIYMDDGRVIDVGGKHQGHLRRAIDALSSAKEGSGE